MAAKDWIGTEFRVLEGATLGAIDLGYSGGDVFLFTEKLAEKYDPDQWLRVPVVEVVKTRRPTRGPSEIKPRAILEVKTEEAPDGE